MKNTHPEKILTKLCWYSIIHPNKIFWRGCKKDFGSKDAVQELYLEIRIKEIHEDEERTERERKAMEENDWIVI